MAMRSFVKQWTPGFMLVTAGLVGAAFIGMEIEDAEQARAWADFRSAGALGYEVVRDDAALALNRLEAVEAFWTAGPRSGPADFHRFVGELGGFHEDAPIRAVALAPRVKRDAQDLFLARLAETETERRALGYPAYRIWPDFDGREEGFPAVYVEPAHARPGVLGYDMSSDPSRRVAMLRAAGEGRIISSAPVRLTQDKGDPRSSVLLLAPLYADRTVGPNADQPWWHVWPDTVEREDRRFGFPRRAAHVGYVAMGYSPSIGLADKMRVLAREHRLSVAVWDGGSVTNTLRGTTPSALPTAGSPALFHASGPAFADGTEKAHLNLVRRLDFAGRVWWVGFAGLEGFRPTLSRALPFILAAAVVFGAVALAALSQRLLAQQAILAKGVAERTSALVQANTALRDSRSRAEAANAAKTQFLSAMSHELRTPLNAIIGFAQMLRDGIGLGQTPAERDANVSAYAGYILTAGESLLAQVGRILDLSRIEAGRLSLEPEPVDLGADAREVVAMMQSVAEARAVRLTCDIVPDVPRALADRQACRQILENLVANAIKFSHAHKTVTVRVEATLLDPGLPVGACGGPGTFVRLTVQDEGIGIPADQIDRVTEPFHQVADQMTRQHGGLGLGLAIVRELVEGLHGRLSIASEEGRGTRVQVLLPSVSGDIPGLPPPRDSGARTARDVAAQG
jgi:signal transduction histidine kinase